MDSAKPRRGAGFEVRRRRRLPVAERREFRLADLSPAHDGLKVVHLTDVHVGRATPARRVRAAVEMANAFHPDLVVMTGDYLSYSEKGLRLLREQLGGLQAPVVAVLGNHDHWVDADGAVRALESLGYAVLRNQHTRLTLLGEALTVVGIDDLMTGHADVARAFRGVPEKGSRLGLAHVPRTADLLGDHRASMIFAGHTHGGHVNIPPLTPALFRRFEGPYLAGCYQLPDRQLYVSRGLGGAVFPFRVRAEPEVTLVTLRSSHPERARAA
jgi:predicted MPP superfamily phosphohydrolase